MKARNMFFFGAGSLVGAGIVTALLFNAAPMLMVNETTSPLGHEATVDAIVSTAKERGWKIPTTHSLHVTMKKFGHEVQPATVVELCQPDHAAKLLKKSDTRLVTSFMPCRVAVYERDGGEVVISRMNSGLMSHLFPGEVGDVMNDATGETEAILAEAVGQAS